jgi:hypothetical protein
MKSTADRAAQQDMNLLLTALLKNRHESGADGASLTTDTNLLWHESTIDGATQEHRWKRYNKLESTADGATEYTWNLPPTALLNNTHEYTADGATQQDTNILLTALLNNRHESTADGATQQQTRIYCLQRYSTTDTNLLLTALLNNTHWPTGLRK